MNTKTIAQTNLGPAFIRLMAAVMESRFRYRFFGPMPILQGANLQPGQTVLEVGCGTGFFTLPIARLLGNQGRLVAMDILPESVDAVTRKVKMAALNNVLVTQGDVLHTQLAAGSLDVVLIFGVIPAPMLPMQPLLSEMHRILKPGGTMAVWPPSWVLRSIDRSGLFRFRGKRNGVSSFLAA